MTLLKNCWVSWAFISWSETPRSAIVLWDSTMALANSSAAWLILCCCCSFIKLALLSSGSFTQRSIVLTIWGDPLHRLSAGREEGGDGAWCRGQQQQRKRRQ